MSRYVQKMSKTVHIPLWERPIPKYPLLHKGGPQNRIFFPLFWMKLIKPAENLPNNFVKFQTHPQMTEKDIAQYLQKIYDVKTWSVKTYFEAGEFKKHPQTGDILMRYDDRKYAYVQLADQQTFTFPDILNEKSSMEKNIESMTEAQEEDKRLALKNYDRQSVPEWFW